MILDPIQPIANPAEGQPPPEVVDTLIRMAKAWGCVCRPSVMEWEQNSTANTLTAHLQHAEGCRYRPMSFFEPPPELDEEAIADSAAKMKRLRQRTTRKYNKRKD